MNYCPCMASGYPSNFLVEAHFIHKTEQFTKYNLFQN